MAVSVVIDENSNNSPALQQWQSSWFLLFIVIIGLVLMMLILVWLYHTMQNPRLYLIKTDPTGRPSVTWTAVVRYLLVTAVMIVIWYFVILMILSVATGSRTPQAIGVLAAAVIGAARVLAHMSPEGSHELGKTIPLAVLSVIIIGGGGPSPQGWGHTVLELIDNGSTLDSYYLMLLLLDVVVTIIWFFVVRWRWDRAHSVAQAAARPRPAGPLRRAVRKARDFGKPAPTLTYRVTARAGGDAKEA
ncbi:MAG: hypothetical protein WCI74_16120 [Actinomycetes bacterium]